MKLMAVTLALQALARHALGRPTQQEGEVFSRRAGGGRRVERLASA
jgi:hypothetical protein